jgi:hypothetical protein
MFSEAIHGFLVLIPVVSARIIVSIFLPDHFSLLIVEELQVRVQVREPLVPVDLLYG